MTAAWCDQTDTVRFLVRAGAAINKTNMVCFDAIVDIVSFMLNGYTYTFLVVGCFAYCFRANAYAHAPCETL